MPLDAGRTPPRSSGSSRPAASRPGWCATPTVPLVAHGLRRSPAAPTRTPRRKPGVGLHGRRAARRGRRRSRRQGVPAAARGERASSCASRSARDYFQGSIRMLRDRQDQGFDLLRLALNAAALRRRRGRARARPGAVGAAARDHQPEQHRQPHLVEDRVPRSSLRAPDQRHARIGADHHRATTCATIARRVLTRATRSRSPWSATSTPATLGPVLDRVFGALPAKASSPRCRPRASQEVGRRIVVDLDVPQAVLSFGGAGIARKDPDFMAGLSSSTTSSAAARSRRASTTRCARSAASPMASIRTC